MDSVTHNALCGAFEASFDVFNESLAKGRSKEFARIEAAASFRARAVEALEAESQRNSLDWSHKQGFRERVQASFNKAWTRCRMNQLQSEVWKQFWTDIAGDLQKQLF
jgi:hypothetical protein